MKTLLKTLAFILKFNIGPLEKSRADDNFFQSGEQEKILTISIIRVIVLIVPSLRHGDVYKQTQRIGIWEKIIILRFNRGVRFNRTLR